MANRSTVSSIDEYIAGFPEEPPAGGVASGRQKAATAISWLLEQGASGEEKPQGEVVIARPG